MQRRKRCSDEDFPESCWRAHPWDVERVPACAGPAAVPCGVHSTCEANHEEKKDEKSATGENAAEVDLQKNRCEIEVERRVSVHEEEVDKIEKVKS